MESLHTLRGRVQANHRAARHLLAEKGSQRWSANDQAAFDGLLDEAERSEVLLASRVLAEKSPTVKWARQRDGLDTYLRKPEAQWSAADARTIKAAMSTTTPSEGGFAVGTLVAGDLIDSLKGYGWMRAVAAQITTEKGSDMGVPASDGSAEVGELIVQNQAASASDPAFGNRALPTYKFSSKIIAVPWELIQDSAIDLVQFVFQRMRDRIGRIQNQFFTTGTGSSQPMGVVTAAGNGKVGTTGQTTTVIYDDLVDLADSVDDAYLGVPDRNADVGEVGAGWMLSQTMRKVVRKLKDTNGRPIWTPGEGRAPALLLDYPAFINNDMAAPAANAKTILFGNLSKYLIRDALQVTVFRFDDSAFANKGQVGYLAWARAGGNLLDLGAVKAYQHSAT
jgi:HK97 family phage major capsid protein